MKDLQNLMNRGLLRRIERKQKAIIKKSKSRKGCDQKQKHKQNKKQTTTGEEAKKPF